MSNDIKPIEKIRDDLNNLATVIENLAYAEPPKLELRNRELSGDHIHGGKITKFASTGIKDESSRLVVRVNDDGILTDFIDVDTLVGNTKVEGNLHVGGEITATKLHVQELSADIRQERTTPLEFVADEVNSIYGKGLQWKGKEHTRQFVYRANPDRIFTTETIDLGKDQCLSIDNIPVITANELGSSVTKSNLQQVGSLRNLTVLGDVKIDEFVYWNAGTMRLGIGTDQPNAMLSLASLDAEFIIEPEGDSVKIGTWTNSDVSIVTDDTQRILVSKTGHIHIGIKGTHDAKVTVHGKLGVGVNTIEADVDASIAGPIRVQNKKFEVRDQVPTSGSYKLGDIVWNESPKPTGYIGWVCIKDGTPGIWKPFGQIGA